MTNLCVSFTELRRFASSTSDQICDRMSGLISGMGDVMQAFQLNPGSALSKTVTAAIRRLHNMVVCASDFVVKEGECQQICDRRAETKRAAVHLLNTLLPPAINNMTASITQTYTTNMMHAAIVPCQCLTFGFTYATSIGRLFVELRCITTAMDFLLKMFDIQQWIHSDRYSDLIMETVIGGGACMLDLCLRLPIDMVCASIRQLLNESVIQRLSCLICRQLSVSSSVRTQMISTCNLVLFNISRMMDVCSAGNHIDDCHRLVGPLTTEACKLIWSKCNLDPCSLLSITTPLLLLTHAAAFDPVLNYEYSTHITPDLNASLLYHLNSLPPMGDMQFLKTLAWSSRNSPYIGSIVLAFQAAHHWEHLMKVGILPEERVCCLFSLLLIFSYNIRMFLLGLKNISVTRSNHLLSDALLARRLPVISDFSNYGFETLTLIQLVFQHTDKLIMEGDVVPRWQQPQVFTFSEDLVPIRGLEALTRLWFRRLSPPSRDLQLQKVVTLCLNLVCRHDAISSLTLPAYVSFTSTIIKLVVSGGMSEVSCVHSGLGQDLLPLCLDSLAAVNVCFSLPHSERDVSYMVELQANIATILTLACAGRELSGLEWMADKLTGRIGIQVILALLLTSACEKDTYSPLRVRDFKKQAVVWSEFHACRGVCPIVGRCGNFTCDNKSECSEAALPTLLCSGCRKVRYCSVKCQRHAWIQCEHRNLCC